MKRQRLSYRSFLKKQKRILLTFDRWLCHPIVGTLCFFVIIFFVFYLSFSGIGAFFSQALAKIFTYRLEHIYIWLIKTGASESLCRLIILGVLNGVASVLSCLPQTVILFFLLDFLEACGYIARAIRALDHIFRPIGFSGEAILPLLMGFGCTVPAMIAASHTNEKKNATCLLVFIPCNAKVPLLILIVYHFFEKKRTLVVFFLYLLCISIGIIQAFFLDKKTKLSTLEDKLPPLQLPHISKLIKRTCLNTKEYLIRAGTIVFLACLIVNILGTLTPSFTIAQYKNESILAHFGNLLAPIFSPLGFDDSRLIAALVSGIFAKEMIVSTVEVLIPEGILSILSPAQALSFLIFGFIYSPCITTIYTIKKEFSTEKSVRILIDSTVIAYVISYLTYTIYRIFT